MALHPDLRCSCWPLDLELVEDSPAAFVEPLQHIRELLERNVSRPLSVLANFLVSFFHTSCSQSLRTVSAHGTSSTSEAVGAPYTCCSRREATRRRTANPTGR
jgi:hypothetical protein